MKIKDDPKVQTLTWFLDFISDDIDQMSPLDISKRVIEANHYLSGKFSIMGFEYPSKESLDYERPDPNSWYIKPHRKDILLLIQTDLKALLDEASKCAIDAEKQGHNMFHVGVVDLLLGCLEGTLQVLTLPGLTGDPHGAKGKSGDRPKEADMARKLGEISFTYSLQGIPIDAIKTCPECDKYFLHLSQKPKYYCNPKCTSRALARKRRETDPEKYRKQQREIMRKKYREKKAKEQGKPVEKVKIQKMSAPKKKSKKKEG